MTAPKEITALVERFDRNREAYRSSQYNETQLRREFLDPFFEALGWDVTNKQGHAEAYKDVIHEDAIKIGGYTKAPDYCFRIGGTRKFFVEAKKPAVDIKDAIDPAYQLRRYAWSAKLPLSILTDFEEFAVYDCRMKPTPADKASTARTIYATYSEYPQRWDEIASIFSREAVLKGSFDKYVESSKAKKGTAEVDDAFLVEIESWRDLLAHNLALRNPKLGIHELNFSVQRTIDRIIFLRICEDRGIEEYGRLMAQLNGGEVYARLCQLFQRADERYNSGLFHFRQEKDRAEPPDELTLRLSVDDKPLKEIIKNLYYPDSPYEFSVLPADILGHVYEQFLGKVIRLTSGHRAVVEDKPEVKKAGGVYYTPTYIVDYIVKNTVGELLQGKTPKQVAKLRILDPACGSGSFLIGAYQTLLDWHRDWYVKNGPKKWATGRSPVIYQASGGDWRLTTAERKRILLNNIYGVDIDPQAVEVTKISHYFKVLEGESEQTINRQLTLFRERALPDLGSNIKCGNSLIGPDFYNNRQVSLLDEDEKYKVNIMDWEAEFPKIIKAGGFDVVIGNPPYVRVHRLMAEDKTYLWHHYDTFVAKSDIYACFIQKGVQLLRLGGKLAFITPNTWASLESFTSLRKFVLTNTIIEQMVRTPEKVFKNATVKTFVFVLRKTLPQSRAAGNRVLVLEISDTGQTQDIHSLIQSDMEGSHLHNLLLYSQDAAPVILTKCARSGITIGSEFNFYYGFKTGDDDQFLAIQRLSKFHKPFVRSADIDRYAPLSSSGFVDYRPDVMKTNRPTARPGEQERFERPKVVVARMGQTLVATFDDTGIYVKDAMLLLSPTNNVDQLKTIIGFLNSRLLKYLYENHFVTIDVLKNALLALPLPKTAGAAAADVRHDRILEAVKQMLSLHRQLAEAKTEHDKAVIQRRIEATDGQIDRLVYELYGLTEKEIRVVEAETKP